MKCPYCGQDNDRVIDSRTSHDGFAIRRRRECVRCKGRYTTYERIEDLSIKVIKKGGHREPFQREKIKAGLEKACWKRPIADEEIESVVTAVEHEVYDRFEEEVDSRTVGEIVMQRLVVLDQVAFVRFASVYREFKDIRDFVNELQPILKRNQSRKKSPGP